MKTWNVNQVPWKFLCWRRCLECQLFPGRCSHHWWNYHRWRLWHNQFAGIFSFLSKKWHSWLKFYNFFVSGIQSNSWLAGCFIQGDVKFAEVLEKMGAKVSWTENSVTVTGPPRNSPRDKHLRAIDVNMNKMPDVAMTLAVVALFADGPTAIRDGNFI